MGSSRPAEVIRMLRTLLLMVVTVVAAAEGQSPVSPLQAGTRVRVMKASDRTSHGGQVW
jgi:hypothetical protein